MYELVLEENLLSKDQLDDILAPNAMTKPRENKPKHNVWDKLKRAMRVIQEEDAEEDEDQAHANAP